MTPADIDRVFGRGRLRMVTGDHVEVFREHAAPGDRRRYTKRFLATAAGDFSEWTEREWRILARLVGHGIKPVPDVVRFDRGAADRAALVQTYDAGVTVDHWATLLPLERDGTTLRNVFEDCAHWWALARHSLIALDAIHELQLVHLDLKADNVCIPAGPTDFDPHARGQILQPCFDDIALIDFAFSLVSGERLESALPIAQQADYEYQSPRLLRALEAGRHGDLAPTRQLDWRCDLFSLAAMLWRYLPEFEDTTTGCWTRPRHARARALVRRLIEAHDAALSAQRPHAELIARASEPLAHAELSESLQRGWTLACDSRVAAAASPTPVTRIALPVTSPVTSPVMSPVKTAAAPALATPSACAPHSAPAATPTTRPVAVPRAPTLAPQPRSDAPPEPLAVDPTDVAMRMQARRHERAGRTRRLAWTGGLAATVVVATAAAAWLEPLWRPLLGSRDVQVARAAATAPLPPRAEPAVAVAAPTTSPLPASEAEHESPPAAPRGDTVARATAEPEVAKSGNDGATARAPALTSQAPAGVAPLAAAAKGKEAPRPRVMAHGHVVAPTPERPPAARIARAAMPFPAPSRQVRNGTTSSARSLASHPTRATLVASARRPAAAHAWRASGTAIPWAVAGRAAPRLAFAKASGEGGALQPLPAPLATATAARPGPSAFVAVNAETSASSSELASALPAPTALAVIARPTLSTPPAGAPATGPATAPVAPAPVDVAPVDYAARASELMANQVPRLAQRAERMVARVLFIAGRSERAAGDDEVRAAAAAVGRDGGDALAGLPVSAREAQRLGEAARAEYARRGGSAEALALQARAFGADPLDVEAAGNLAFLLLRERPPQAEAARQLALHALSLHGTGYPQGRIEDWATFAIASALAGRERDATNAFLVILALAPNLERQCKAALDVYAIYGERLRTPVEAMLQSANASGRANGSSLCEWPPHWVASGGAVR